ncbi:MAG: GSCFA domain-containing protein [Bacteroidales bacterium]|nr:GSCFA domain-containing protein [Bacteroidales bacterium]
MGNFLLNTPVPTTPQPFQLTHQDRLLLLGSCFADNIGQRLQDAAFTVKRNPFGALYNPLSTAQCLLRCLEGKPICDEDLVYHNGLWHSWLHHGNFSQPSKENCLKECNTELCQTHEFLEDCNTLIVTFGTAFAYRLASDGRVVGNCHKLPQQTFEKCLLDVDEIVNAWKETLSAACGNGNKPLRVIFTVSPIRHWRDGAHENAISKATLLLAIHKLAAEELHGTVSYFPSFEIMMDELRDYRFYADDMLHPSTLAQNIIWERFLNAYVSDATRAVVQKAELLTRMKTHRPLFPESEAYTQYQRKMAALEEKLKQELMMQHVGSH